MGESDSLLSADWTEIGEGEFAAANLLLSDDKLLAAGRLLPQAVEEYLSRGWLSKGWQLRRTHSLGAPPKDLIGCDGDLAELDDACLKITDFYCESRYSL